MGSNEPEGGGGGSRGVAGEVSGRRHRGSKGGRGGEEGGVQGKNLRTSTIPGTYFHRQTQRHRFPFPVASV